MHRVEEIDPDSFSKEINRAVEMDFTKLNTSSKIDISEHSILFEMRPWEMKTIKVSFI